LRIFEKEILMPRGGANRASLAVKRRYFELIRQGLSGYAASTEVGVSLSCGSLWFIDAGSVQVSESTPLSPRFFSQDDRIEIAEGLAAGEAVKGIASRIGKSYQSVYREIARNRKDDGRYQPWFAHNEAHQRRRRPRARIFEADRKLRDVVAGKLKKRWSPEQTSRWLKRFYPGGPPGMSATRPSTTASIEASSSRRNLMFCEPRASIGIATAGDAPKRDR
jgi:IS30 family transposase